MQVGEVVPMLARHMDKCSIVRSMAHTIDAHSPIPMLTGRANENTAYDDVVTRMLGFRGNMPPYVHAGSRLGDGGGRLGAPYFPLEIADPRGTRLELPSFSLSANLSA